MVLLSPLGELLGWPILALLGFPSLFLAFNTLALFQPGKGVRSAKNAGKTAFLPLGWLKNSPRGASGRAESLTQAVKPLGLADRKKRKGIECNEINP